MIQVTLHVRLKSTRRPAHAAFWVASGIVLGMGFACWLLITHLPVLAR